ncbi:MAG: RebB family R body protein [Oleibacter sp.]|jgi:hypothetical protein|nr:RebB family R body protein [Thalassolituus sp.]
MAFPTSVNDQITDSVTQANVKVLAEAPALAMGNLYQATAQALSNAAHNATNAQNQMNVILQATTTQGVMQLYSANTAVTASAADEIINKSDKDADKTSEAETKKTPVTNEVNETPKANAAAAKTPSAEAEQIAAKVKASNAVLKNTVTEQLDTAEGTLNKQVEDAVKFALECNLGSAEQFNHAVQQTMEAYISALQGMADNAYDNALNVVKVAGITSVLRAMLQHPEQQANYAEMLNTIKSL